MRILVLGLHYAPEQTGIAPFTSDLCEHLQASGHEVKVVTAFPYYPEWRVRDGYRHSIYRRERMVNLGIAPYLFSKIVVLGVFCLLQSAIIVFFVNLKTPFHQGIFLPVIAEITITMMLTSLAGLMIGLVISALTPNTDRALSLVPLVLLPQVIFSGAVFNLNTPILQAIGDVFAMRWAMAALGTSIGLHSDKLGGDQLFGSDTTYHGQLFSTFTRADSVNRMFLSWGALVALIIILTIIMCIGLKRKDIRA